MRLIPGNWELRDAPLPALRRGLVIAALGFVVLPDRRVPEPSPATTG
jgi:hypothetical protein